MPIDPTIPKDNDLISTFPAAIREARQIVADYEAGAIPISASAVTVVPSGSLTSNTAQAAIDELENKKAAITQLHDAVTVLDSTSIDLTLTGQQLSAAAIFGTTAGTVAQGNDSRFVTNGDSHDHSEGDGGQIAYSSLSGLPTLPAGAVVGTTDTQTLTNKTISLASNTISGTLVQFNTAISDADILDTATAASTYAPTAKGVTNGDSHDHIGGAGALITESALSFSDVTTNNVSYAKHGLMPKTYPSSVAVTDQFGNVVYSTGQDGLPLIGTLSDTPVFDKLNIASGTNVTGVLAVANGGTGSSTQNFVDLTTDQSIAGNKSFTGNTNLGDAEATDTHAVKGTTTLLANSASAALKVTQTGTGPAFVVEDADSPDSTPFVVHTNGRVTAYSNQIGHIQNTTVAGIAESLMPAGLVSWVGNSVGGLCLGQQITSAVPPIAYFYKTRGGNTATPTSVLNGDATGSMRFHGYYDSAFVENARIQCAVDGTPGTGSMPGRLVFSTTASGSSTPTERMRISSAGNVLIGTTTDDGVNKLQVNGAAKATQWNVSAMATAPASATATGTLGEVRITATHIYVCTATNTWVRAALYTWT